MKRKNYKYKRRLRKPRRLRKRKSILRSRVFWYFILGIILVGSITYFLFFSTVFKIKEIKFISPREISVQQLQGVLGQELQKKWLYFFKMDSFFLLRSQAIENKILKTFPEIKTANLRKKFPDSLLLEVKKRKAIAVWCTLIDERCFLMDDERIIFAETKKEDLKENLPLILSEDGNSKSILEEACPEREMNQILEIQNTLQGRFNIDIENFTKGKLGLLEVKMVKGWEIYFDSITDIALALTKLELLLEEEVSEEERKNLEYIDLRFSKVYYK